MGDLFDFQDEEHELSQLVAGAVDEDKCGHTGDSAHVGARKRAHSQQASNVGAKKRLLRTRSASCAGKELRGI